jgi:hypothetical protein
MPAKRPDYAPWHPPKYEFADASAIQALIRGDADGPTQQRAIAFIVNVLGGTYEMPYSPTNERDTSFACGRMFVGQQIVKLSRLNIAKLANASKPTEQG